jgi:subtilisin-like proprotein convertase family protein
MVTVNDTEPPVINCPTNLIVATTSGRCDAIGNYTVTATDNSQNVTVVCAPPSGSLLPIGTNNVLCTATDSASNSVSCAFAITVVDQEKPVITCATNMVIYTERGRCDAHVTYVANATDNCGTASLVCNPPSGTSFPKGTNIVTCTASDARGNTENCAFTVRVLDNESPVVSCPGKMIMALPPGQCDMALNYTATVADNCPGATVSCSPPSGSIVAKGTLTVNCTGRDSSGNTANCSFVVEVRDQENPVITCPADINSSSYPGACGAPVTYSATVRDNCPGATISCNPPTGAMMPVGTNSVTCNAVDSSGNTASCTFRVVVRDTERPTLNCPADIVIDGASGNCNPAATYSPTMHDNCLGTSVSCIPPSGTTFPAGTNRVQCTVMDPSANMASCSFSVIVRLQALTATPLQSQTRCTGQTATFGTIANGSGPITFAWLKDGAPIAGQTNASLTRSNLAVADAATYSVMVSSPCSTVTHSATLNVNAPVAISGMTNVTRCDCDPLVLSPIVSGTGPFGYVWRKNGFVLAGATSNTLAFSKLSTNDAGVYSVEVTGPCNSAVANATVAMIKVPNPAVYTNAGVITINDNAAAFPYPSSVRVTCVPQPVKRATVTLRSFSHGYPDDVDVMLVSPDGQCVMLMSDAGDGTMANNVNITLDDTATISLLDAGQLFSGTFRPGNYDTEVDAFPPPAPQLPPVGNLSALAGASANGFWSLFVVDDFRLDGGVINNGWVLRLYWESNPARLTAPRVLPGGGFQMTVTGDPTSTHAIEASSDLVTWTTIATITLSGPQTEFTDPNPAAVRFYRATQP